MRGIPAARVSHEAVGLALDERWAFAGTGPRHRLRRDVVHCQDVLTVDDHARHSVALGPWRDVARGEGDLCRGGRRVEVVLADEDRGEFPQGRYVERFAECPLVACTLTEEGDRDLLRATVPGGKGCPIGQGDLCADDAVAPKKPQFRAEDVHRSAHAAAVSGVPPHQFGHHRLHISALGDGVSVASVGAGDEVVYFKRGANAYLGTLLADGKVCGARDHAPGLHIVLIGRPVALLLVALVAVERTDLFLKGPDPNHQAEHLDKLYVVRLHGISPW